MRRSEPLLGTFVTMTTYGDSPERMNRAISAAFDTFREVDALMSIHRSDSEIARVNAGAAARPVQVSRDLFQVLQTGWKISDQTEGAFDYTIRPIADLWGFIWKEYRMPSAEELRAALARVDYRKVILDAHQKTARFSEEGVSIDLGGIAKGYAVDLAIEKLRTLGIDRALVKAGGDLRVSGLPPGKAFWEIQLEDPEKKGRRTIARLRSGALSTSGNYENYFEVAGRRYSHILNPKTGFPVEGIAACTVLAPTCMESDAWATALFVYGPDRSAKKFNDAIAFRFTLSPSKDRRWRVIRSKLFEEVMGQD